METRGNRVTGLLPDGAADRLGTGAALLAFGSDLDDVLNPDTTVAASGQTAERQHAVLAQAVDELAGHSEHLGSSRRADLVLGSQHDDTRPVGDVVEHGAHGRLDRRVADELLSEVLSTRADGRIGRVESRGECVRCHDLHANCICNNDNDEVRRTPTREPDARWAPAGVAGAGAGTWSRSALSGAPMRCARGRLVRWRSAGLPDVFIQVGLIDNALDAEDPCAMETVLSRFGAIAVGGGLLAAFMTGCSSEAIESAPAPNRMWVEEPQVDPAAADCEGDLPRVEAPGYNSTSRRTADIQEVVGAAPDGVYGIETTARVMLWQKCHDLEVDGVWGIATDALAFAEADAAADAETAAEQDHLREATRWHCRDETSFDRDAYNDNYCVNAYEYRWVSDSEAVRLDPDYWPGKSGHEWYNDQ